MERKKAKLRCADMLIPSGKTLKGGRTRVGEKGEGYLWWERGRDTVREGKKNSERLGKEGKKEEKKGTERGKGGRGNFDDCFSYL